ncbi:MAG: PUA domain-containing protein [Ignisphaera sp.]
MELDRMWFGAMSLKIQYLSKKLLKEVLRSVEARSEIDRIFIDTLKQYEEIRLASDEDFSIIVFDSAPMLFKVKGYDAYIPTLYALNYFYNTKGVRILPTVVVDEGAVKPLLRGADIMIPGIRKVVGSFSKGQLVAVMHPSERYFIVVGIALMDSIGIAPTVKGKCISNISHLEDNVWKASLQLAKSLSK